MSTVDRPINRQRRKSAGYSFIEVVITLGIVSLMALVVERTLASTHEAERFLHAIRKATERGQNLAYEVREAVSASRKLFGNDTSGLGYWNALDTTRDPPDALARLPLFDEVNVMGPDAPGDPHTGNILLFVREADADPIAGFPQTVHPGVSVTLDGSGSSDPDGDPLLYFWTILEQPAASTAMARITRSGNRSRYIFRSGC